jgi:diadenylate cyclase
MRSPRRARAAEIKSATIGPNFVPRPSVYTSAVTSETLLRLFDRMRSAWSEPWELIVELLLIGLSVNWCAGVLHGTRGTRLLRGLLIVLVGVTLVVRVLSAQLGWTRLELLYGYFVTGLGLIALVAFQPELRRALIRAGEVRFLRRSRESDRLIAALVESAGNLSRNRHGALIGIQRDVGLANWTENGVPINAEVSANLLNSIFYPNSPLHDLGVIVHGHRILAASCQFPMAESGETDGRLGSRHRAAVGLSAESDALVLVVSEETGTISLAEQGELRTMKSIEELDRELHARLNGAAEGRGESAAGRRGAAWSVRRMLRRGAVVAPLTLVIWFLADQASLIRLENVPATLAVISQPAIQIDFPRAQPDAIKLSLRGPTRQIEAIRQLTAQQPLRLEWSVAAPFDRPGRTVLDKRELLALLEGLPALRDRGVGVEDVSPDRLEFTADDVVVQQWPLRLDTGAVRLTESRIEPAKVQVRVRKSDLDRIPEAERTIAVRVEDLLTGMDSQQLLTFPHVPIDDVVGPVPLLGVSPAEASVSLRIAANTLRRLIKGIPVHVQASTSFLQQFELRVEDENEWLVEVEVEGERMRVET